MDCSHFLNVLALFLGFISAILMFYFPPATTVYTVEGKVQFNLVSEEDVEGGARKARRHIVLSKAAPILLSVSFVLQMIGTFYKS